RAESLPGSEGPIRRARGARPPCALPLLEAEADPVGSRAARVVQRAACAAIRAPLAAAGPGRVGGDADHGLRRPRRGTPRALAQAPGQRLLGPLRHDLPVRHELRLLALAPQPAPRALPGGGRRPGHALRRAVLGLPALGQLAHAARPLLPPDPEVGVLAAVGVLLGHVALRRPARSVPATG